MPISPSGGLFVDTAVPGLDAPARIVGAGFLFEHDGPGAPGPVPGLGEHTGEILAELGYDRDEIGRLREEGAI